MSARPIVTFPSPVLAERAREVTEVTGTIHELLDDMVDTMFEENGIGVAAPQVGEGLRAIVIDADLENRGSRILKVLNPVFTQTEGSLIWPEGCLSIPGLVLDIHRHESVLVEGLDEHGEPLQLEASGLLAVAFQHEVDHLDGRLILDRVSALKRNHYRKKILKHGYPVEMPGEAAEESA